MRKTRRGLPARPGATCGAQVREIKRAQATCRDQNGIPRPRDGTLQRSGMHLEARECDLKRSGGPNGNGHYIWQGAGQHPESSGRHSAAIRRGRRGSGITMRGLQGGIQGGRRAICRDQNGIPRAREGDLQRSGMGRVISDTPLHDAGQERRDRGTRRGRDDASGCGYFGRGAGEQVPASKQAGAAIFFRTHAFFVKAGRRGYRLSQ
jgi:hypothetical protein